MMNSRWNIHRVGLVDFWYYDEEEFYFLDGRMLLRGANGSGKSVTMQSFIPLLLDGNMRPERLDPFGSRARKMENYLLEEGDEREERTGYLFMEFKREDSDTYVSLGIGMRARKNKKLEPWYFCITDGRRIGKDLFLYKDVQNKIACTKLELRNRIGDGGRVMETQSEYAQCVNKLLFGFETIEEYKELLDLLIQLRTPKLSKDFKPTVINDILSSSLQTLSEDDLRPMSEAIENMDALKTNLDTLLESVNGAKQIEKVYDRYNQIVLYDKALLFTDAVKEKSDLEKKQQELQEGIARVGRDRKEEARHYEELKQEETVLAKEKDSLSDSDAVRLKEQEIRFSKALEEVQAQEMQKQRQQTEKEEKYRDIQNKKQEQEEKNERLWEEMEENLDDMEAELEGIPFDEAAFFRKEFTQAKEEAFSFQSHNRLLEDYMQRVEKGKTALVEEQTVQERYDRFLQELDACGDLRTQAEREVQQYDNQLHEIKGELIEQLYQWEKNNEELHVPPEVLQETARRIEAYEKDTDFSEIKELAFPFVREKQKAYDREGNEKEQQIREVKEQKKQTEEEWKLWKNQKDPEPERSEAVQKNRARLKEKGIFYEPFYKTVDFAEHLSASEASRLEEALLQMGILDALLVSADDREKILEMDEGLCDRYLFSDVAHVKQSLLEVLDVDNGAQDILFYQRVSHILSSIGYACRDAGSTCVDTGGNYRIGVLEGTVTGTYEARFIGAGARENYRRQKIEELEELLLKLQKEEAGYQQELEAIKEKNRKLETEWKTYPSEQDLKVAAKEFAKKEYQLELLSSRLGEIRERTEKERKKLEELRFQVREICGKCYLTPRLDVFQSAQTALGNYRNGLMKVQIAHGNYRNGMRYVRSQEEYLETIDADLDDIRYELGTLTRQRRETEAELVSVREQLQLTDYEQIQDRLEACMLRLGQIPQEREISVGRQQDLKNQEERFIEKYGENEKKLEHLKRRSQWLERAFAEEYRLGYVEMDGFGSEHVEKQAELVCSRMAGKFGSKKQSDLLGNLQEVYHQNRMYLLEYQMTLETRFADMDEETSVFEVSMKRIDISAKYRGMPVRFKELIQKLSQDAEEQRQLLSDRDRELFEDILANTISKKIRGKIQASKGWVEKMNGLMESMQTSSGLKLSLRWKNKRAETEEQLDTRTLVELLQKDVEIMRPEEVDRLSAHFRSKIEEARKIADETGSVQSFHSVMREVLDYRKWFEFQLECQKTGEKKKELTDRVFFTFSGGEKAMAMYVPLFSAVVAKYAGARADAPRLISLDEAFAGVDETNIRDMFRLMVEFEFNFMINSQILWGDCDTVPGIAIYQLVRPENAKYVTVIPYIWNGYTRNLVKDAGEIAQYGQT